MSAGVILITSRDDGDVAEPVGKRCFDTDVRGRGEKWTSGLGWVDAGEVYGIEMRMLDVSLLLGVVDWRSTSRLVSSANFASRIVVVLVGWEKSSVEMA